ncbi:sigma-70 family RNA polymerase sigma factor [uncultured Bacteroides sp.]|uniref:RNA polymerase sigma factor n=1 Tax=uncultured Bacteroides sp. TaxID=162156 RepID=UPI002AA6F6FD|nr:sigma-70 family RNA polymerase sigma factor [uncultured Bacteroides sp.]
MIPIKKKKVQTVLSNNSNIATVVEKYQERLKNFVRRRVDSVEDAKDILQEVFFHLAKSDSLTKPIEQMEAWLYTVTRNEITDWNRKKKNESIVEFWDNDGEEEDMTDELDSLLFGESLTPEDEYLRSLVWQELEKALSELPAEQKNVFEMTELQGLSFKEISVQTGVTVNTLISRKRYAVLFLRERLKSLYMDVLDY